MICIAKQIDCILLNKPSLKKLNRDALLLIPVLGALLFIGIYFIATLYYPGGSQIDANSTGFSWADNYWCNLLNAKAMNGKINPASPIAGSGMIVISITLVMFWYLLPKYIRYGKYEAIAIQGSGFLAMLVAAFLSSAYHDTVIYTATFFGLIALFGTFLGLFRAQWHFLLGFGVFNLLVTVIDLYIYTTKDYLVILPIVQKINFLFFLIWIMMVNVRIYKSQIPNITPSLVEGPNPKSHD